MKVLTIEEFNAASSAAARRIMIALAAGVVFGILYGAAVFPVKDSIRAWYVQWIGGEAAEILMGLMPFPALVALFVGIWVGERQSRRDPRLRCPHCTKMLKDMRHVVVATRNCGNCGRRVLAEPEEPS